MTLQYGIYPIFSAISNVWPSKNLNENLGNVFIVTDKSIIAQSMKVN